MSSSPSVPAPPNYQPIADALQAQSAQSAKISQDQLNWAKQQYNDNLPYTNEVKDKLLQSLNENTANAEKDRARYEQVYQPIEDAAVKDANTYASPENMARMRGRAMGTVGAAFDAAGDSARRNLESFGVDPSSTRMQALDVGVKTQRAAALAAAGNNSDLATENTQRQLQQNMINVGKGYPGQVTASYGTGTGAGTAGNGAQNSTLATSSPALGNPTAWAALSNQSLGTWGNMLGQMYQGQMQGYSAQMNSSSGLGGALGGLGGLAMGAASLYKGFKDGGAVPPISAGDKVPAAASPSGGRAIDDVPASVNGSPQPKAAINVGEFIMPQRTTNYYGTKFMKGLIDKADQAMGVGPQHVGPTMKAAPQRSALPV